MVRKRTCFSVICRRKRKEKKVNVDWMLMKPWKC